MSSVGRFRLAGRYRLIHAYPTGSFLAFFRRIQGWSMSRISIKVRFPRSLYSYSKKDLTPVMSAADSSVESTFESEAWQHIWLAYKGIMWVMLNEIGEPYSFFFMVMPRAVISSMDLPTNEIRGKRVYS